jgi:hypothetical protein
MPVSALKVPVGGGGGYRVKLGEFTMVSQPIRLILVDFFVRSSSIFFEVVFFFLGHLSLFCLRSSSIVFRLSF